MEGLKGQNLNMSHSLSKPEFKQQYLAPIRALSPSEQCDILEEVVRKEIALGDLKTLATKAKAMNSLKMLFTRLTNVDSWEMAQKRFPALATTSQLECFVGFDSKKTVPKAFQDFCQ